MNDTASELVGRRGIGAHRVDTSFVPTLLEPAALPANRFGQLLVETRTQNGLDLDAIASTSEFTIGELLDIEAGHRILRADEMDALQSLYSNDAGLRIQERAPLEIDLTAMSISASGHRVRLDSTDHAHVLDSYLSLVYDMRNRKPGTQIPLRDDDVSVLATSLSAEEEFVFEQLVAGMVADDKKQPRLTAILRRYRRATALAGAFGLVAVGSLAFSSSDELAETETSEPEPEPDNTRSVEPATALVVAPTPVAPVDDVATAEPAPELVVAAEPVISSELVGEELATESAAVDIEAAAQPTPTETDDVETTPSMPSMAESPEALPHMIETDAPVVASEVQVPDATSEPVAQTEPNHTVLGRQAVELLPFEIGTVLPGWTVEFLGERPGHRGLTFRDTLRVEVYVRQSDTPQSIAGILAHELGHAIDLTYFEDVDRFTWMRARGIETAPWWPESHASDFHTGAGDLAESFAYWAVGDPSDSQIAGTPSSQQLSVLEALLPAGLAT